MGILPWSSTRGRPHPRGGRAGLSADGPVEAGALGAPALSGDPAVSAHAEASGDAAVVAAWRAVRAVGTAPPSAAELAGLEAALTEFRAVVPVSTVEAPSQRRRHEGRRHMTPATLGSRLGVAAAGVLLLSFGGVGAFALTGSLSEADPQAVPAAAPTTGAARGPVAPVAGSAPTTDDETEDADDADEAGESGKGTEKPNGAPTTAVGPDATGPAAFGLCNAWSHAKPSKQTATHSVAFRNLVAAAGGEDKVAAYCASVEHPSAAKTHKPSSQPTGKPTDRPGRGGSAHPTGKPSTSPAQPSTSPGKGPTTSPTAQD